MRARVQLQFFFVRDELFTKQIKRKPDYKARRDERRVIGKEIEAIKDRRMLNAFKPPPSPPPAPVGATRLVKRDQYSREINRNNLVIPRVKFMQYKRDRLIEATSRFRLHLTQEKSSPKCTV